MKIISPLLSGSRNPPETSFVPLGQVAVRLFTFPPPGTVAEFVTNVRLPSDPVAPFAPVGPVAPPAPVLPVAPVAPSAPFAPVAPVAPFAPVAPVAPFAPLTPCIP
ncbi:MAG: hypothetical protein LBL87_02590 [Ruminococcus sp.]|nr:hypothetical protein [Ruminococcus sp.]